MKIRQQKKLALLCSLALMAGSIPVTGLMPVKAQEAEEAVQMSEALPAEAPEVSAEGEALPEAEPWLPEEMPVTDEDAVPEPGPGLTGEFSEDVFEEEPEFLSLPGEEISDELFEELIEDEEAITEWSDPAWEDEESDPVMEEEASEEADIPGEDELILEEPQFLGDHALCELTVSYTNASFDEDLQPCGDLIDLGTLDLSKREFETSKDVYIVNTSFTNETDTINGQTEWITVYSGVTDEAGVFLGGTNTSQGVTLPRRMKSETVSVAVNAFNRIAGTYSGNLWIRTEPESTVIKGGRYATGTLGEETSGYTLIPVKVTLTGINPDLPGRVENLQAQEGNGSVRLTWDALDDFDETYFVYRREGVETETDPDLYSEPTYQWVNTIEPVEGGETVSFTDTTVTNGVTYSYFVIAGAGSYSYPQNPTHPGCGYACQAVSATPGEDVLPRPEAPDLSGGVLSDGVDLAWTLQNPKENGEEEIDYFKVYRNGQYVARVDRSSVHLDTSNGEYRWDVTVPCNTSASYTWWVTAVSLDGMESYESNYFENDLYYSVPVVTGHHAWYTEEGEYDYLTEENYLLYQGICIRVEVESEASIEKVKVWRDGVFLDEVDKNLVTADDEYDFLDKTVEYGKTYTYEIVVTDWNEKESERYAFQIRTPANEQAYDEDTTGEIYASRSIYATWSVLGGTTQKLVFDGSPDTTYILYRNDQALKTWIHPDGEIVYKDTPDTDGTYVYRLGVLRNGILFLGKEQTFIRNTQETELPQKPGKPIVQGRIVNSQVWLSWEKGEGAEPDGYYIYRMDGTVLNTGRYNEHASGPESYEGAQGRYARLSPEQTSFVDSVWWETEEYSPDNFPVTYWVCAHNQYGLSDVSEADKISFMPVDGQAPGNEETQAPGRPQIESVTLEAQEGNDPRYADLTVSFREPENGGGIDEYEIVFESIDNADSTLTVSKYPGIDSEGGLISAYRLLNFPNDYGDYRITVTARNCVDTAADTAQVSVRQIPKFEVALSDTQAGTALLSWEMAAGETVEDGFEIWRKAGGGDWQLLDKTAENQYTDTELENGVTYAYYVSLAQAGQDTGSQEGRIILSGRSVVRSVTPSASQVQPGAPWNLHAAAGDGVILVYWNEPVDGGTVEQYQIEYEQGDDQSAYWRRIWPYYPYIDRLGRGSGGAVISAEYKTDKIRVTAVNQGDKCGESEPLQLSFTDEEIGEGSSHEPGVVWPYAEGSDGQVTVKWSNRNAGAGSDIAFYIIGRYDTGYNGYLNTVCVAAVDDPDHEYAWTDTDVVNGTKYRYRIMAQGKNGRAHSNDQVSQLYVAEATPWAAADTALEAEQVEAAIDGLPEPTDFDPADEEQAGAVRAAKALYYNLNAATKKALNPEKKEKLLADIEKLETYASENRYAVVDDIVQEIKGMIGSLPSAEDLTADTLTDELREKIDLIKGACDDLPDSALAQVDNIGRLTALEEKIKAIDDAGGNNPGGDNPGGDNPGGDNPGGDNPGGNNPGGDNPGGNTPGGNTPGGNPPGGNTPVNPGGTGGGSGQPGTQPGTGGTGGPASGGTQPAAGAPVGTSGIYGSGASLATYLVTGDDTVTYVKCQAAKKAKSLSVPDTLTINGKVYRVTAVAANAFARRDKATKISIGANVASIGAKAFNKCKKLKTLTVKSKLLTPAGCKKCLKGSSVTAVKVPKAKKKAYKKLFKKSVCGKSVKLK